MLREMQMNQNKGLSGKVKFLQQGENAPITFSVAGTVSLTNEPFVNFLFNDTATFDRRGLNKTVPIFTPGGDDLFRGNRLILTLALPIHHQAQSIKYIYLVYAHFRLRSKVRGRNWWIQSWKCDRPKPRN